VAELNRFRFVMAGLVPAIHVFGIEERHECQGEAAICRNVPRQKADLKWIRPPSRGAPKSPKSNKKGCGDYQDCTDRKHEFEMPTRPRGVGS
jgi:hypothetical protein